jgi:hypothetical protein
MQQQHRRSVAADDGMNDRARRLNFLRAKAREELRIDGKGLLRRLARGRPGAGERHAARNECRRTAEQLSAVPIVRVRIVDWRAHRLALPCLPQAS